MLKSDEKQQWKVSVLVIAVIVGIAYWPEEIMRFYSADAVWGKFLAL